MSDNFLIREKKDTDLPFIMSSWLNSYREQSPFWRMRRFDYFKLEREIVDFIIARAGVRTMVLASQDDPDVIYGYAVFEKQEKANVFHYIYIKHSLCQFGLSKRLIGAAPFDAAGAVASHLTPTGLRLIKKYNMTYNPYLI